MLVRVQSIAEQVRLQAPLLRLLLTPQELQDLRKASSLARYAVPCGPYFRLDVEELRLEDWFHELEVWAWGHRGLDVEDCDCDWWLEEWLPDDLAPAVLLRKLRWHQPTSGFVDLETDDPVPDVALEGLGVTL